MADDFDIEAMLEAPYKKVGKHRFGGEFLKIHYTWNYCCIIKYYPQTLF